MVAGGTILKGTNSLLALLLVAVAGATGCLLGSLAAYAIGASGGRPLMLKYGRYVLISQHDADKADAFFQRWGSATAFFSRLLPVVRTYISLPAGISKMPLVKFSIYTFLGSLIWSLLLAYVGTIIHANLDALGPIFHAFDAVIVVALVALIVLYVGRHLRNDRKAREAHAAEAVAGQVPSQNWAQSASQAPQLQPQGQFRNPQSAQGWGQQPQQPAQQAWNAQQPAPQQGWGQQPQQPAQQAWNAQQPAPQQGWGQQPQQPAQQGWNQQPAQQAWGTPQNPQVPQTPQNWGQQPPSPQPWPPQTGR